MMEQIENAADMWASRVTEVQKRRTGGKIMEYEKVKQWLDDVVDMAEHSKSLEAFNTSIYTIDLICNIQLYKGIDIVSDVMDIELTVEPRKYDDGSEYIRSSFVYRSFEFVQLNEVKDGIVCEE